MITPSFSLTATERVLPRLALDFTTGVLDARVTITRALNTATRVNSGGFIEIVNANLPRFDYNPTSLAAPRGLLIEEARTNASVFSQEFENANWGKTRVSVSNDVVVSPDGTQNADKLVEDSSASTSHFISQTYTLTAVPYTASIFAKKGERSWVFVKLAASGGNGAYFDLENGVVGTVTAGYTASIVDYGTGWYRCSITVTATVASWSFEIQTAISDNGRLYTGDGTSGIYVWGAQVEAGAFVTSYIPTTTTSLTRNADAVSMTGTNFSSWYNATESTLFAEASTFSNVATDKFVANINNNGFPNRILMNFSATNNFAAAVVSNSVTQVIGTNGTATTLNTPIKMCFATKLNSFAFSQSGVAPTTSVSGVMPVTVDRLWIGGANTAAFLNGHMRQVKYWPQRLTNAEVQAFSK